MTVLCFKDGILAADTAIWAGDVLCGHVRKITRTSDGCLVAATGSSAECERFAKWAEACEDDFWRGFEASEDEDFCGIIIEPEGNAVVVDHLGRVLTRGTFDCLAEGCASDLAMGAMMAGASAAEAVALCIANHAYVGGDVQIEALHPVRLAEAA